jgi:tRNA-splicing ligase RtcB
MLILKGKYNTAVVYTDKIEPEAEAQIIELLNQDFIQGAKVAIMPDVHTGVGCTIGFTADLGDKVIPNIVGVDIGCGMLTVELGKRDIDLERLDAVIYEHIPSGFSVHKSRIAPFAALQDLHCYRKLKNTKRLERSIGTLGGGNHFIEVNADQKGSKYLVIHTGSRNLGKQVAEYYQRLAVKLCSGTRYPKPLCYLWGERRDQYLHDMKICQSFAALNRRVIGDTILQHLYGKTVDDFPHFSTIHNYLDFSDNIIRKGAISARKGEKVIIPINMRDGSILAIGKGNPDWNYSAPHGAGRLMSRTEAKEAFDLKDFQAAMEGIYSTSVAKSTLDEIPMAYKPIEEILNNIHDTVEVIEVIKPIYNFKAK